MSQLSAYAGRSTDQKYSRFAWVMNAMFDEVLDELGDVEQSTMSEWFVYFGQIIEWCGSGDQSVLPEHVRTYLTQNHPSEVQLAIEAPKADESASVNA